MAVTPGSASKLNKIAGVTSVLALTAGEEATQAVQDKVLPKNILVKFSNGKVAMSDGVKKISELLPLIDQTLNETEKGALVKTFSGVDGAYKATEGGFLVLGADGRMASGELPAAVFDSATGKFLLSALPDSVRAGVTYVADIAARDAATDEQKKSLVFVIDASADATVEAGSALYAWIAATSQWEKIAEHESLDIDVDSLKPTYEHVEAAGAVMYDHTVLVEAPTLTDLLAFDAPAGV